MKSSLITRMNAVTFWQWLCNDSIAGLSMRVLCNMLAVISSLCSPVFCQLVNLSWTNWTVKLVREADCCWNNLYFKCSFHIFCHFIFKWPHIKSRCYQHFHTVHSVWAGKPLGPFTMTEWLKKNCANIFKWLNRWVKHRDLPHKKACTTAFVRLHISVCRLVFDYKRGCILRSDAVISSVKCSIIKVQLAHLEAFT